MAPRVRIAAPSSSRFKELRRIVPDIRVAAAEALRESAREAIKELQEVGPAYSGKFRERWQTEVEGRGRKVSIKTGIARFNDQDFKSNKPLAILIGNSSPYAEEAMDLIPGRFEAQKEDPIKAPVASGKRVGSRRGEVVDMSFDEMIESGVKRPAISTAEQDWYATYMGAGAFGQAHRRGAGRGFGNAAKRRRK